MSRSRIQPLTPLVANQIAAGEVIERPASIVKELLENALDAGANNISIEIGFGGLNQIKISDNGEGILAEDLPLAILAHATSKINQLKDLYAIKSMGFRGEALASIAAVARLSISSKPDEQPHAMMLQYDSTKPILLPCARNQGTTVEVIDLFYNAPVRKNFLKTPRSEYQAIEMIVKRFALSVPSIALTLKHDGKQIMSLPAANCDKTHEIRIKKLLGKEFIEQAIHLDIEHGGMCLSGWISAPTYDRSQNDKQWIYINQRMVKDKLMNHAIKQAYDGLLHPGRYPACVLYLTLSSAEVDVNVHPTKHEVRFQQPRLVHDFIATHLLKALTLAKTKLAQQISSSTPTAKDLSEESQYLIKPINTFDQPKINTGWSKQSIINKPPMNLTEEFVYQPLSVLKYHNEYVNEQWITLNNDHALIFLNESPYLIDVKHLWHDHLLYLLMQQTLPLANRPLLVPVRYKLTHPDKKNSINQLQTLLNDYGIQWEWSLETTLLVNTIPKLLPQLDIKRLFASLETQSHATNPSTFLKLLLNHLNAETPNLQQDDKRMLINHLQQKYILSDLNIPGGLQLDQKKCQEILYG